MGLFFPKKLFRHRQQPSANDFLQTNPTRKFTSPASRLCGDSRGGEMRDRQATGC